MRLYVIRSKIILIFRNALISVCILTPLIVMSGAPAPDIEFDEQEMEITPMDRELVHGGIESHAGDVSGSRVAVSHGRDEFVRPDKAVAVRVSNRDVNRVRCHGRISDVTYSQEKPVEIVSGGAENLYVKFKVVQAGGERSYIADSVDLHVTCNGSVYTMILHPHPIDSVTIRLEGKMDRDIEKMWGKLSFEDRIKRLITAIWRDEVPSGFNRIKTEKVEKTPRYEDIEIKPVYSLRGNGAGLLATEYAVKALRPVSMDERYFLRPEFGNVIAITLDPMMLYETGDRARLIVVERVVRNVD